MFSRQEIIDEMKTIASRNYLSLFELVDEEKRNPDTVTVLFYHVETRETVGCLCFDLNKLNGPWAEKTKEWINNRMVEMRLITYYADNNPIELR